MVLETFIGKEVQWTSQAQGFRKEKRGKVIAVVPAGANIWEYIPKGTARTRAKIGDHVAQRDRVLVEVPQGQKNSYYTPRPENLQFVIDIL